MFHFKHRFNNLVSEATFYRFAVKLDKARPEAEIMVVGEGFEPSKAKPSDLQSDPFDHSGTPPKIAKNSNKTTP